MSQSVKIRQVKEWIGGLYIELQLTQQRARDYQQALATTREELRNLQVRLKPQGDLPTLEEVERIDEEH